MSQLSYAAAIDAFGEPTQLRARAMPRPNPGRGEIEIEIQAASVNPIDTRRRTGYGKRIFGLTGAAHLPLVLGNDFAGIVTAVGAGSIPFQPGDAVFGAKPASSSGTHASHTIVAAVHAVLQPTNVPVASLATLPYNYLTVSRALSGAGLDPITAINRKVLVYGATGGLGLLAIQILSSWGAQVVAVGGSDPDQMCRKAGAVTTLNRHECPLTSLSATFCATLNFASWDDDVALLRCLAPTALGHATAVHPMMVNFDHAGLLRGGIANIQSQRRMRALMPTGARYSWALFKPNAQVLAQLAVRASKLITQTTFPYSLDEAAEAHRHVEQRLTGRAVFIPSLSAQESSSRRQILKKIK